MEPREGVQPQKRRLATLFSTIPRVKNRPRLSPEQRQKRRRENRQNSTRRQRCDPKRDAAAKPDRGRRGHHRGFVLGPSRHRAQYTSKLRLGATGARRPDMEAIAWALAAALAAADGLRLRATAAPKYYFQLQPVKAGPEVGRGAKSYTGEALQGGAGVASRVGLGHRPRRAGRAGERSDGAGGRAQEAQPARVRRHGADRKAQARGEGIPKPGARINSWPSRSS